MTPACRLAGWRFLLLKTLLVKTLVKIFQKGPIPVNGLVCVVGIDRVVTPEHFIRAVTGYFHYDGLSDAGFPHVRVEAVPKVMEDKATFLESAIIHASILASLDEAGFD